MPLNCGLGWLTCGVPISAANRAVTDVQRRVIFAPDANKNGNPYASFNFVLNDGFVDSTAAIATVNVTPVNEAPVLTAIPDVTFDEDQSDNSIDLDTYFNDVETLAENATFAVTSSFAEVTTTIDPITHVLTITGEANYNGVGNITIQVTDTGDGASAPLSDTDTFTVTVTPVNDAPVIENRVFSLDENSNLLTALGTAVGTDLDLNDTLTWSITGGNTGGAFAINSATGEITVANKAALDFETTPVLI